MKSIALASCVALFAASIQDKTANLPLADSNKLRALYADALAKEEPARGQLLALGKKLAAKYAPDDLHAALRKGPLIDAGSIKPRKIDKKLEEHHTFEKTTVGYSFECDLGVFRYCVDVPSDYDPKKPAPVLLDPGHGTGKGKSDEDKAGYLSFYRGQCKQAGLDGWLLARTEIVEQIGADGLKGSAPDDQIARVFELFWRDLASRYAIDPDRLYVTGLSQTGYWAWYLGRATADRYAGIAPMSAVTWQVDHYLSNFSNLPMFVLHGDQDPVCPVAQPRATCSKLEKLGFAPKYVEVAGSAHDHDTWSRLNEGLTWLAEKPRAKYAKKISKAFQTLENPWCGFVRVEELESTGDGKGGTRPTATLEAGIEKQVVTLVSKGVKRAKIFLSRELVDLSQPVEVVWNEKRVFQGKVVRGFATTLEVALERADWTQLFEGEVAVRAP